MSLLPCAHCGGEAELQRDDNDETPFPHSVNCRLCGAASGYCNTKKEAREQWNRRVIPSPTLRDVFAAALIIPLLLNNMPDPECLKKAYKAADNLIAMRKELGL